jgi:hypothetical protein
VEIIENISSKTDENYSKMCEWCDSYEKLFAEKNRCELCNFLLK